MNANTTPFASSGNYEHSQQVNRRLAGAARALRGSTSNEGRPQVLPLVLAVLPLRPVIHEGRASSRHA
ncbi:MAG: hypothetical protein ABIV50_10705 [Opitutus sp.]